MLPKVWHFPFPGCGKARRALGKGCWGMNVNLTCSIHWLLQIQLDLLVSPGFILLISKGSRSSDFLMWFQPEKVYCQMVAWSFRAALVGM